MNNLLSSNFSRIFKWGVFWATTVLMAAIAAFYIITNKLSGRTLEDIPFVILQFFPIIVAAVGGMFLSHEYTNNTIRNKLIVGHSRENVYFANYITISVVSIIMYAAYMTVIFAMGLTMLDTSDISVKVLVINSLIGILVIMVSVSVVVLMCMLLKSAVSIIAAVMVNFFFMFCTIFIQEFPDNPFCKVIDVILPTSVSVHMNLFEVAETAEQSVAYMVVLCAVITLLGVHLFKKSDLK